MTSDAVRTPEQTRLSAATVASYAAGSVGTGGFGVLPGLVLAYYLTDTLAVPPVLAALVVLIPKLVDVAVNPLIGVRSDRALATTGRRSAGMYAGALTLAPLFVLTFCTPTGWPPAAAAIWVLVTFTLTSVAYGFFQVPYIALPTELTGDYHERTRLVASRIAVLAAAILVVGAGGPAVRDAVGGAVGYLVMAVAAGVVITAGMLVAATGAARRASGAPTGPAAPDHGYRESLDALRESSRFRNLLTIFVLQTLATAVMLAGAQYVATYVLDEPSALTLLFVALVAPAILVMPAWYRFGRRVGKETALTVATLFFVAGAASMVASVWSSGLWILGSVAMAGIGYAGMQTFPLALLPDVIDDNTARTGRDSGGAMSGLWTAGDTIGLALGPAIFLLVLGVTGFASSSGDDTPEQSTTALVGIVVGFSVVPAVLAALALPLIRGCRPQKGSPR